MCSRSRGRTPTCWCSEFARRWVHGRRGDPVMASRRRWPGCAANGYVARMRLGLSCAAASSTVAVARAAERATIVRAGVALCCALLLGGCESYVGARATTVHGKHGHKTCAQLLAEHKSTSSRIDELTALIAQGRAGGRGPPDRSRRLRSDAWRRRARNDASSTRRSRRSAAGSGARTRRCARDSGV